MSNVVLQDGQYVIVSQGPEVPADLRALPDPMGSRRAGVRLLYDGVDITRDIAPWALSVEFSDGIEAADDLQVKLYDDGRWTGAWAPQFGAELKAEIYLEEMGQRAVLPLGLFTVDEMGSDDPPATASIKAVSADVATNVRREQKTRAWENVSFRGIAETIAKNAGLTLMYLATPNPQYSRKDQSKQSDLDFLVGLGIREGLRIKTSNGQLVVIAQADIDAETAIDTIRPGDGRYKSRSLKSGVSNSYSSAIVSYRDAAAKKLLEYRYTVPDAPATGQTYRVKKRCESLAEAQRVAQNEVARMNRWGQSGSITIVGDTRIVATSNITLAGMGSLFDGLWTVEEARHSLWPYQTELKVVKVG